MASWSSLLNPKGVYTSKSFPISNNLDRYLTTIKTQVINTYNQKVELYFSVSYDSVTWSDWVFFSESSHDLLDSYSLNGLIFRYKIVLEAENETKKPYFQSIDIKFEPFGNIENTGDLPLRPKLWITKRNGAGNIAIINHTTGQRMEFKNLRNNEELFIDCENEEIVSSFQSSGIYRYDDHNDEYLELIRGDNYIKSEGDFDLEARFANILLQE